MSSLKQKKSSKRIDVSKKTKVKKVELTISDRIAKVYGKVIDGIEKDLQLNSNLIAQKRLSTGSLVNDFVLGGGLVPGMYSVAGQEASAKSTDAMQVLGSALKKGVPIIEYYDAEGSVDPDYTCGILGVKQLSDVFGEQDIKGNWIIPPKARYYGTEVLEQVFAGIQRTLNRLPDKIRRNDGKYYLVFSRKRKDKERIQALGLTGHNKELFAKTGRYWFEVEDDSLQALFIVDSYPALLPEDVAEEISEGNAMALIAREMSKWIPRFKGKLAKKAAVVYGVNQIRLRPAQAHGNPEYEPAGEALKFYSDARNRRRAVVPPDGFTRSKDNGGICVEKSVEYPGAVDSYMFKSITNIKNKKGTPMRKGMSRVWIEDGEGKARGFDPVYDTWEFLRMIGVISQSPTVAMGKKGFSINLPQYEKIKFTWNGFKKLILAQEAGSNKQIKSAMKELGIKEKPGKIRRECFKLLRTGKAAEYYQIVKKGKATIDDEDEDLEDEE